MDVAIYSLNFNNHTLEFSSAHSPLIYIHDNQMHHIRGERFPVGGFKLKNKKTFMRQIIAIQNYSTYCLFSDDFPDQLGGENGRRYTLKRLKKLLMDIHQLPMKHQKKILEERLKESMGNGFDQIDDILVIGFRV